MAGFWTLVLGLDMGAETPAGRVRPVEQRYPDGFISAERGKLREAVSFQRSAVSFQPEGGWGALSGLGFRRVRDPGRCSGLGLGCPIGVEKGACVAGFHRTDGLEGTVLGGSDGIEVDSSPVWRSVPPKQIHQTNLVGVRAVQDDVVCAVEADLLVARGMERPGEPGC